MREYRQICFNIPEEIFSDLIVHSRRLRMTPHQLAATLFCGAFCVLKPATGNNLFRMKPMTDLAALLWIAGNDTLDIARITGMTETMVLQTLDGWRKQLAAETNYSTAGVISS